VDAAPAGITDATESPLGDAGPVKAAAVSGAFEHTDQLDAGELLQIVEGEGKRVIDSRKFTGNNFHRSTRKGDFGRLSILREIEALILPAFHPADHFLYLSAEPSQAHGSAIGAIAMRAIAVNDEESLRRKGGEVAFVNAGVGKINRSWDVPVGKGTRAANIKDNKALFPAFERGMNVPAIGFKRQKPLEVSQSVQRVCGVDLGQHQ